MTGVTNDTPAGGAAGGSDAEIKQLMVNLAPHSVWLTIVPVWGDHPFLESVSKKPWPDSYDAPITKYGANLEYVRKDLVATPLEVRIRELEAERDEWKAASQGHHPNPADHRYWEGRYRDEKARAEAAEAKLATIERETLKRVAHMIRSTAYTNSVGKRCLQPIPAGHEGYDMHHATIADAVLGMAKEKTDE